MRLPLLRAPQAASAAALCLAAAALALLHASPAARPGVGAFAGTTLAGLQLHSAAHARAPHAPSAGGAPSAAPDGCLQRETAWCCLR